MFIGSPTRDLFSYSVERIAVVALLLLLVVVAIWVYRSGKRHD
jgi:cbb3-type cytochrome oxidase subunit 3